MPHLVELALHIKTTAYTPPTACTHYRNWYAYFRECPYPSDEVLPDGLPVNPRERPPIVCSQTEVYPPWTYGPHPRFCRRCHTICYPGQWSTSGLGPGSCFCLDCRARLKRSKRLHKAVKLRRRYTQADVFWNLPKSQRGAFLDETSRLDRIAHFLGRPVPPPWRVLGVPAYWKAPRPAPDQIPLPRITPPHIRGASKTPGNVVFDPNSRPWKRFLSSLTAPAASTYAPAAPTL